jgi:lysophospholipid acyltransferase (LPLAT)-like uncharacterized protein
MTAPMSAPATDPTPGRERVARHPWWMGSAATLGALLLRVLGATWRIDRRGLAGFDARIAAGERCVFAFWHARLLPLVFTHRDRGVVVLISRHRDGELIARIIKKLGFRTARGSSTRGGEEGARDLLRHGEEGALLGIAPDGPRGPAETVKPGLAWLASRTGLPVLPVASAARSAWVFRSWDRFRVPKPFARVVVSYGEPVAIPAAADAEALEAWRVRLDEAIATITRQVKSRAGEEDA